MRKQASLAILTLVAAMGLGLVGCASDPDLLSSDFKIRDQFLSAAHPGERYERGIVAKGGLEPYREWQLVLGALPEGIKVEDTSGVLYGTPGEAEGIYPFLVKAQDASHNPDVDVSAMVLQVISQGSGPLYRRSCEIETDYWAEHAPSGLSLSSVEGGDRQYTDYNAAGRLSGLYLAAAAWRRTIIQQDPDQDSQGAIDALSTTLGALHALLQITGEPGLLASGFERDSIQLLCCDDLADPDCDADFLCGEGVPEGHAGQGDYAGYHWIGDAGRDTYSAVIFGLTVAYDAVQNQPGKERIALDMAALLDRIWQGNLRIIDVDGEPTSLGNVSGTNPDEDSRRALAALAWHRAAWYVTGEQRFEQRYFELLDDRDYRRIVTGPTDIYSGYDTDFSEALDCALNLYLLLSVEQDDELRQIYSNTFNHSFWTSETGFRRGDAERNPLATLMIVDRLDYWPDAPLYAGWSQLARFPAAPLENFAVDLGGNVDVDPDMPGWAADALWIDQRPPAQFAWADNPYLLQRGADDGRRFSGVDFQLAYWLGRYSGMVLAQW
ncbi:MAG: Ig domain-containing protein [Candidatus Alcyoniella australis]|nr:Ig domain-containing protein [Candidatus Alcyoniella australis]